LRICLWDTFSQENYQKTAVTFYSKVDVVVLCFDLSDRTSFDSLNRWHDEVVLQTPSEAVIFLVGLKLDLKQAVTKLEIDQWMGAHPTVKSYFATSAKSEEGIDDLVDAILNECQSKLNPEK
jgi:GTPase SAR1 family protein